MQIGLVRYEPVWELVLRQIGIPFSVVSDGSNLLNDFSVIIVNGTMDTFLQTSLEDFVRRGGSVLYTTNSVNAVDDRTVSKSFVRSLPPSKNDLYQFNGILDLFSRVSFFHNNDFADVEPFGDGWKAYLGIDINVAISTNSQRNNFYRNTGRMPNETVALRSKGTLRQLIFSLIQKLHHLQQMPFVHQWYYPDSEPTVFTMRIDSDKGTQSQIEQIYQLSERHNNPTTWFLDVKSHESWLPYFKKFEHQEIGVHCYEHLLHRSTILNRENFEKALMLLRKNNLNPKGITAPTGEWNKEYAEAIESLGFQYSSEFAYDYDNLPSYPFMKNRFLPFPQLPIHPVCIGTMLRARMSDEEMAAHYRTVIDTNILLNEPICLYHHPTHEHNGVFEEVFRYINERNILKLSYTQYSDWWKQRSSTLPQLRFSDGTIESSSGDTYCRIILPDLSEAIISINGKIDLNKVSFTMVKREIESPKNIMSSRTFDARHILQNALDWWIKTTE